MSHWLSAEVCEKLNHRAVLGGQGWVRRGSSEVVMRRDFSNTGKEAEQEGISFWPARGLVSEEGESTKLTTE